MRPLICTPQVPTPEQPEPDRVAICSTVKSQAISPSISSLPFLLSSTTALPTLVPTVIVSLLPTEVERRSVCKLYSATSSAAELKDGPADYYAGDQATVPDCPTDPADATLRTIRFPLSRPKHGGGFIHLENGVASAAACITRCVDFTGCKSCTFAASTGKCQLYPKLYLGSKYRVPHGSKDLYSLAPCRAPCPASVIGRFEHYPSLRPRHARGNYAQSTVATAARCADACVADGAGRCTAFNYLHHVASPNFGRCRLYGRAKNGYSDQYTVANAIQDYYVLAEPHGCRAIPRTAEAWRRFAASQAEDTEPELPMQGHRYFSQLRFPCIDVLRVLHAQCWLVCTLANLITAGCPILSTV